MMTESEMQIRVNSALVSLTRWPAHLTHWQEPPAYTVYDARGKALGHGDTPKEAWQAALRKVCEEVDPDAPTLSENMAQGRKDAVAGPRGCTCSRAAQDAGDGRGGHR